MAANSFGLFVQQLQAADDELKVKIVQILFDLLMVQDIQTLLEKTMAVSAHLLASMTLPDCLGEDIRRGADYEADQLVELVRLALRQEAPEVQAVACEGVAKLMLAGMIQDETASLSLAPSLPRSLLESKSVMSCLLHLTKADTAIIGTAVLFPRDSG